MKKDNQIQLNSNCLGLVLAGGKSSRMGREKALLSKPLDGKSAGLEQTMLEFSTQLLRSAGIEDIMISGANIGGVADLYPQGGPLSGIYTAIKTYRPQAILALPVDMPFLTPAQLKSLKIKGEIGHQATIFTGSSLPIYLPVNALVEESLNQAFHSEAFIRSGRGPSFKQIFKLAGGREIKPDNQHSLINTNTPEQWQQAINQLNKGQAQKPAQL
jgi:molybdopterin-guanine dinucleotide biosynthesis protein A